MRYNFLAVGRKRKYNKNYPRHLQVKKSWFYYVRTVEEGCPPKWYPLKTQHEGEALQRWAAIEAHLNQESGFDVSRIERSNKRTIAFSALVEKYFADVVDNDTDVADDEDAKILSESTKKNYRRMSEELIKQFKNKPTNKITRQEIIRYHRSLKRKRYEANRRKALLHVIFQFATDEGFISVNPADNIKNFREKKHKLRLTEDVLFKKIYPIAEPMLKRAIILAFHLVQHENEVKRLEWKDFDFEKSVVSFTRRKTDEPIVINYSENATLVAFLEYLRANRRELSPYMICHKSPKGWVPYNHFRSLWKNALDKAGYLDKNGVPQFKFKEIRHLSNTLLKDANISADKRRAMTGHKTNQANEVYTHPSGADTIDSSRALSRFCPEKF